MKVGTYLDFGQNEVRNAVIHKLSSAPSSPVEGQKYYNTTSHVEFTWNGTAWRPTDAAGLTDGSIALSALATNPLARANHTGTQLAVTISDLATTVQAYRHDQFAAPNTSVSWGSQKITNLLDPTSAQDAATKAYVDSNIQSSAAGIDSKPSVRVVATANITLSGTQTIDGISVVAGDRVLVTAQTTASQNGVYVCAAGAWGRAVDADTTGEITPGAFWFVEEGTTYGKTQWRCNNTGTITINTTSITIIQFGAASSYTASGGVQLVGSDFSIKLDSTPGLVISGSGIKVDHSLVPYKYAGTITGNGSLSSFTVTHNLGTTDVVVMVMDGSGNQVIVDVQASSTTAVTVVFGAAVANAVTYRVVVIG